ncbi:MAG: hypothetical protein A3H97_18535 [Acidobacteria bacterium RIFCSPLOWO2_02_FULL_65_29]|nr:MAG: hypothetical protein A3H97_18535 [Acidobacteria bacterium RIFCSPLOWO2_02_FULL_65_29]
MYLETARALLQGVMLLVFAAIVYWVSLPVALGLVALMGVLKIQESVTDWCPSDLFLRPMGLKKRWEAKT